MRALRCHLRSSRFFDRQVRARVALLILKTLLCRQVEGGKEKKSKFSSPWCLALALTLVLLVLALSFFSLRYLWSPSLAKVGTNISSLLVKLVGLIEIVGGKTSCFSAEAKPSWSHQREKTNCPVRETGGDHTESQKRLSAVCIVFWEIKRSVAYREKGTACVLLCSVLAVRCVILPIWAPKPQMLPFICSALTQRAGLTMTDPNNSKSTLIAADRGGCGWDCNLTAM